MVHDSRPDRDAGLELARVLVVNDDVASRLTLQTLLEAGGYRVDAAATAAEAVGKMEDQEYQLVLSDLQIESPDAGLKVLAHAKMMDYKPATALITAYHCVNDSPIGRRTRMLVQPEDVPDLLTKVA